MYKTIREKDTAGGWPSHRVWYHSFYIGFSSVDWPTDIIEHPVVLFDFWQLVLISPKSSTSFCPHTRILIKLSTVCTPILLKTFYSRFLRIQCDGSNILVYLNLLWCWTLVKFLWPCARCRILAHVSIVYDFTRNKTLADFKWKKSMKPQPALKPLAPGLDAN